MLQYTPRVNSCSPCVILDTSRLKSRDTRIDTVGSIENGMWNLICEAVC